MPLDVACQFWHIVVVIDRSKKLQASFYALPSGRKPVREWILELDKEDRLIIGKDVQKAEFGWPIGLPSCRPMGGGIYEIRSSLTGNRIGRILFCIGKGEMVLLHGFVKKTQKTPQAELELALKRRKEIA